MYGSTFLANYAALFAGCLFAEIVDRYKDISGPVK